MAEWKDKYNKNVLKYLEDYKNGDVTKCDAILELSETATLINITIKQLMKQYYVDKDMYDDLYNYALDCVRKEIEKFKSNTVQGKFKPKVNQNFSEYIKYQLKGKLLTYCNEYGLEQVYVRKSIMEEIEKAERNFIKKNNRKPSGLDSRSEVDFEKTTEIQELISGCEFMNGIREQIRKMLESWNRDKENPEVDPEVESAVKEKISIANQGRLPGQMFEKRNESLDTLIYNAVEEYMIFSVFLEGYQNWKNRKLMIKVRQRVRKYEEHAKKNDEKGKKETLEFCEKHLIAADELGLTMDEKIYIRRKLKERYKISLDQDLDADEPRTTLVDTIPTSETPETMFFYGNGIKNLEDTASEAFFDNDEQKNAFHVWKEMLFEKIHRKEPPIFTLEEKKRVLYELFGTSFVDEDLDDDDIILEYDNILDVFASKGFHLR